MTRLASPLLALLLAVPLAAAGQPRPDPQRGLVAAYALDGDATDAVTGARAAAVATRPTEDRHGARAGALWFDGVRAAVNLGTALQPARFTVAAWIRPQAVDRPQVVVSKIRNMPGHYQANLELRLDPGGRLFLHVPSGQGWEGVQGTRPVAAGRWTHVAAVYDGARAQLYVDGAPDGAPLAVRYAQTAAELFIGARPEGGAADGRGAAGPTWFFFGALDDVSIWDRALGEAELAIVSGRAPAAPPAPPPHAEPARPAPAPGRAAPIAAYPLDGDARDALGGRDGAAVGTKPAPDRAGAAGGALAFGGKGHVDLGVRAVPERFSLSVWVRPARVDREQAVFSQRSERSGRERWLELAIASGRASLRVPGAGVAKAVTSAKRLTAARWVHLAATYDGARAILYVDGVAAAEARLGHDPLAGLALLGARPLAGRGPVRVAAPLDGLMDDLRVFREALTPEEVALLARAGGRPGPGRGDDDDEDDGGLLLARVGRLLVRFDVACASRDPRRMARAEERIAGELEQALQEARGERDLVQRLRAALRELERERGQYDGVSLDRKRGALTALADALWSDLADELGGGATWPAADERGPAREGW